MVLNHYSREGKKWKARTLKKSGGTKPFLSGGLIADYPTVGHAQIKSN